MKLCGSELLQQQRCLSFRQFIPEVYFVLPSYDQQYRTMAINIWKSYMCTLVEETNIEAILAAMNTTELMVEIQAWIFFSSVHSCEDCFYIHVFNISAHIWFSYIYSHYSPLQRVIWIQHNDQLPVGLLAQLVEHCTSITEVMDSDSIWAWIFSRPYFNY